MSDPITMMAIGAGVGALKGAVTGGNPLKEALIGGALGGITGGAGQALGLGGAAAGTGGATAGKVATDLSTGQVLASSVPNTTGVNAFLEVPNVVSSGMSSLPTAGVGAFTQAPSMFDKLSKYATIDNLAGANAIASKFQPKPMSPAPQGRITEGQPMKAGLGQGGVEGLLAELQKRQQQQYQPISLL